VISRVVMRTSNRLLGLLQCRRHRPLVLLSSVVRTAIPVTRPVTSALRHSMRLGLLAAGAWRIVRLIYVVVRPRSLFAVGASASSS
jgi:hypothetical protein